MESKAKDPRAFWPHAVALTLLLLALPQQESTGYYTILRWVVCAAFLLLALEARELRKDRWVWIWGVLTGIFNPIVPVHATRELWVVVDIITIGIVAFDLFVKHESMSKFRHITASAIKWCGGMVVRLAISATVLIFMLFIVDFVITRWG